MHILRNRMKLSWMVKGNKRKHMAEYCHRDNHSLTMKHDTLIHRLLFTFENGEH